MTDRIRNLQNKLKSKIENEEEIGAIIAYVPIGGCIISSLNSKSKNHLTQFHISQANELNIAIIVIYILIWFIENFPLTSWLFGKKSFFNPLIESLWVLLLTAYIVFSIKGIYEAINDKTWSYPYRKEINQKLKEYFKKIKG